MEFTCPNCDFCFHLSPQNTDVYTFTASTNHNFAEVECPECEHATVVFFHLGDKNLLNILNRLGVSNTRKALPSQDVRDFYDLAAGTTERPEVHELSPRMEAEIAALAASLAAMPDDVLSDLMASPPPKSLMPKRWA